MSAPRRCGLSLAAALLVGPGLVPAQAQPLAPDVDRAALLVAQGRHLEARPLLEARLRTQPDDPAARVLAGQVAFALLQPAEAIPHYERLVALRPGDHGARLALAEALLLSGRFAQGRAALAPLASVPGGADALQSVDSEIQLFGRLRRNHLWAGIGAGAAVAGWIVFIWWAGSRLRRL